jgi:hypothetical protein
MPFWFDRARGHCEPTGSARSSRFGDGPSRAIPAAVGCVVSDNNEHLKLEIRLKESRWGWGSFSQEFAFNDLPADIESMCPAWKRPRDSTRCSILEL